MTWAGGTRSGVVVGDEYPDSLPTGARFVPVMWADGSRDNVDTRVLSGIARWFAECPECAGHLYAHVSRATWPRVTGGGTEWACITPGCEHPALADADVYLEHDEWHEAAPDDVRPELLALCVYRTNETGGE
jgi:hypothetical protein